MRVLIKLAVQQRIAGFTATTNDECFVLPADVRVLNEHGDIEIGTGRMARSYMASEVVSVQYIR